MSADVHALVRQVDLSRREMHEALAAYTAAYRRWTEAMRAASRGGATLEQVCGFSSGQ